MIATEPEQGAGELEQAEVVARLLFPADQDAAAFREPADRPLHDPPASWVPLRTGRSLVANERDVRLVLEVDAGAPSIPSGFFAQQNAEHVSAILFTNSGTLGKFQRMGFQTGFGCDTVSIRRTGFSFNPEPDAMDPTFFSYDLDRPPLVESWAQGLAVLHNPYCARPVPNNFFPHAVSGYLKDGTYAVDTTASGWHPIASKTTSFHLGEAKAKLRAVAWGSNRLAVSAITREEFRSAGGSIDSDIDPSVEEQGRFSDDTGSFLDVLFFDGVDKDWFYVILARDEQFRFGSIEVESGFLSRDRARIALQVKVSELLSLPQRIFPQH